MAMVMSHGTVAREGGEQSNRDEGQNSLARLNEGVQWIQKHPVLSAVIWVLGKVMAAGGDDDEKGDKGEEEEGEQGLSAARESSAEGGKEGKGSGRLSWSDENGGSLTEYYADLRDPSGSREGLASPDICGYREVRRGFPQGPEGLHLSSSDLDEPSLAQLLRNGSLGSICEEEEEQEGQPPKDRPNFLPCEKRLPAAGTWSPEWGWFVGMTPPQEHFPSASATDSSRKGRGRA